MTISPDKTETDVLRTELRRLERWFKDRLERPGCTAQAITVGMALAEAERIGSANTEKLPDEIQEWIWHMDLHVTEHDERHAGLALRAAWPHVRKYMLEEGFPENGHAGSVQSSVWRVSLPDTTACHFGSRSAAEAYAGKHGTVLEIRLQDTIRALPDAAPLPSSVEESVRECLRKMADPTDCGESFERWPIYWPVQDEQGGCVLCGNGTVTDPAISAEDHAATCGFRMAYELLGKLERNIPSATLERK